MLWETSRGDVAAAAWIFRRGSRGDAAARATELGETKIFPWRRVAATPRPQRGYSVEAVAATPRRARPTESVFDSFCGVAMVMISKGVAKSCRSLEGRSKRGASIPLGRHGSPPSHRFPAQGSTASVQFACRACSSAAQRASLAGRALAAAAAAQQTSAPSLARPHASAARATAASTTASGSLGATVAPRARTARAATQSRRSIWYYRAARRERQARAKSPALLSARLSPLAKPEARPDAERDTGSQPGAPPEPAAPSRQQRDRRQAHR